MQIIFILQLSISYVQKEEKWFHTLQTQDINKSNLNVEIRTSLMADTFCKEN